MAQSIERKIPYTLGIEVLALLGVALLLGPTAGLLALGDVFATIEDFAASTSGIAKSKLLVLHSTRHQSPTSPVAGIVVFEREPDSRTAIVFVLTPVAQGGFREDAASRPFDITDPSAHTNIESIDVQAADRFSVQRNSLSGCAIHREIFRFRKTRSGWLLAGLDSDSPDCSEARSPDLGVGVGESLSINFLTGRHVRHTFKNDKLVRTNKWRKRFPQFPLSAFTFGDERYSQLP